MNCETQKGFTLVEVLLTLAIGSLLLAGLANVSRSSIGLAEEVSAQSQLDQQAQSAVQLMSEMLRSSRRLFIPQQDLFNNSDRDYRRLGTNGAILSFDISPTRDFNTDLVPDADQDGDGVIDEDPGADTNNDFAPGLFGIDDDGDGSVDEGSIDDDDEDGLVDEDPVNGADDDNDGQIDEDPGADLNDDGAPGVAGVDDDNDGQIDEGGDNERDQESGAANHDWFDTGVFYVEYPGILRLSTPVPWDVTNNGTVTGRDVQIETVVTGVVELEFELLPRATRHSDLVRMRLVLEDDDGRTAVAETTAMVGGSL